MVSKTELFKDVFEGSVPISAKLPFEACIEYAGLPIVETQWNFKGVDKAYESLCQIIQTDTIPVGGEEKNPAVFKILDSQGYQVTSSGSIQHADCVTLFPEEYSEFSKNPTNFFVEKIFPRMFKALDSNAAKRSMVLAEAAMAFNERSMNVGQLIKVLSDKYGFFVPPRGSSVVVLANFDE